MKKLLLFFVFLNFTYLFFAIDLIKLPSEEKYTIGNNKFTYYEDYYKNNPTIKKYYCKEQDITLSEFSISKYEVTVKEIKKFTEEIKYPFAFYKSNYWNEYFNDKANENNSCTMLNLYESLMFIQWYSKKNNTEYRFPTNAEWEYAAIHNNKNELPFGNQTGIFKDFYLETKRYENSVFTPKDDCSDFSINGVLGGSEIVLDNYSENMYESFDKLQINPLYFDDNTCFTIRSGDINYNQKDISDRFGLYFHNYVFFESRYGNEIRLVYSPNTIFNKGRIDECVWYQNRGVVKNNSEVYFSLDKSSIKNNLEEMHEIITLYKTTDNKFYRCYYKINNEWNVGWILSSQINITDKPWYEDPL